MLEQPGLHFLYAGRVAAGDEGLRLVASIWQAEEGAQEARLSSAFDFEQGGEAKEEVVELFPLSIMLPFEQPEEAQIIREFRGRARPGELEAYVEEARGGTYADVAARHGPAALFLAVQPPDRFVTVSVWTNWESIAQATGGDIRHPLATQHSHRLVEANATHYEIVPSTIAGEPSGRGATSS